MAEKDIHSFEDVPLTRGEYINAIVHLYRGEIHRSTTWRQRLDTTTNWAVFTTAGILSFSFTTPEHPHIVLLLSNLIIVAYMFIEARRFRYFGVYRARVRMIEKNFLAPILRRHLPSPMAVWGETVAADLDAPKFKNSLLACVAFRLRRNYAWMFAILLGSWLAKLAIHPEVSTSFQTFWTRLALGSVPSWVVLGVTLMFYVALGVLMVSDTRHRRGTGVEDEVIGVESDISRWVE